MFRSRFHEAFPRAAPSVGPQDIEQGVLGETPSPDVEGLLCALLGLVLNRKKPVESVEPLFGGHYVCISNYMELSRADSTGI